MSFSSSPIRSPKVFAAAFAARAAAQLCAGGHSVDLFDLYVEEFDPRLRARERRSYLTESIVSECRISSSG